MVLFQVVIVPRSVKGTSASTADLRLLCEATVRKVFDRVDRFAVNEAADTVLDLVSDIIGYVEHSAPWSLVKAGETVRAATVLYYAAQALRLASVLFHPIMPGQTPEIWARLG